MKIGYLKKCTTVVYKSGTQPNEPSKQDAAGLMGIATTNHTQRAMARFGIIEAVSPNFGLHNSVSFGGVLFLLPALLSQSLLTIKETHKISERYYKLKSIIITLAFMALCRIKKSRAIKTMCTWRNGQINWFR